MTGRLTLLDVAMMATTEPPPVPWIVHPLLVRSGVSMLAGREGTGKSMLALGLAAALGNGSTVAGMEAAAPGRTLYVDAENGPGEVHRRIRALGAVPASLTYASAEAFDLRAPDQSRQLRLLVDEHKPDVIVLDSLRSLSPSLDENDSAAAESFIAPLRVLARANACAILILAHAGKGDSGREYRGSSALGAAVEAGFTLSRELTDPDKRTRRKLSCWKMRPAAEPETIWISLDASDGRLSIGEAEPYTAAFEGDSATSATAQRFGAVVIEHGEVAWSELCALAGTTPNGTAKEARRQAESAGLIVKTSRGRYDRPGRSDGPPVQGLSESDGRTMDLRAEVRPSELGAPV